MYYVRDAIKPLHCQWYFKLQLALACSSRSGVTAVIAGVIVVVLASLLIIGLDNSEELERPDENKNGIEMVVTRDV